MKITKTITTAILCIGLATFTNSCSDNHDDSKEVAEEMNEAKFSGKNEKEVDKLVEAYASNLYEIKASENAEMNAATPEVKRLAGMLVSAHGKMNNQVKDLADKKGVTLPTDLTDDQRKQMEKLAEKTGLDYDKEFTDQMKEKHEHAISFYEKIADKCEDADIRSWATNTLTEVRSHLDMVANTQRVVKEIKK